MQENAGEERGQHGNNDTIRSFCPLFSAWSEAFTSPYFASGISLSVRLILPLILEQ